MRTEVITWKQIHQFGDLWWQHLELRKKLFVDLYGWSVPHTKEVEWDQYDTAETVYLITHEHGKVLSASRIIPCDFESGGWTYMIRDAHLGKLQGIPCDIIESPPITPKVWEATRFTVDPQLSSSDRNLVLAENASALAHHAKNIGIDSLIALMPPAYIRWLSSLGLKTARVGPTRKDGGNKSICVMKMEIAHLC